MNRRSFLAGATLTFAGLSSVAEARMPTGNLIGFLGDLHLGGGVGPRLQALEADVYRGPRVPWFHVGDLVNEGTPELYRMARYLRDRWRTDLGVQDTLNGPMGNHELMGADPYWTAYGAAEGEQTVQGMRVVWVSPRVLQSDRTSIVIEPAQLSWLDKTLAAKPTTPTILLQHAPPRGSLRSTAPDGRNVPGQFSSLDSPWYMLDAYPSSDGAYKALLERHRQIKLIVCGHAHPLVGVQDLVTWAPAGKSWIPTVCVPAPIRADSRLASIYVEVCSWGMKIWQRDHPYGSQMGAWNVIERPVWRT